MKELCWEIKLFSSIIYKFENHLYLSLREGNNRWLMSISHQEIKYKVTYIDSGSRSRISAPPSPCKINVHHWWNSFSSPPWCSCDQSNPVLWYFCPFSLKILNVIVKIPTKVKLLNFGVKRRNLLQGASLQHNLQVLISMSTNWGQGMK